jgi:hypothetical protein
LTCRLTTRVQRRVGARGFGQVAPGVGPPGHCKALSGHLVTLVAPVHQGQVSDDPRTQERPRPNEPGLKPQREPRQLSKHPVPHWSTPARKTQDQ